MNGIPGGDGPAAVATGHEQRFDALLAEYPERAKDAYRTLCERLAEQRVQFSGKALPTSLKPLFAARKYHDVWVYHLERFVRTAERCVEQAVASRDFHDLLKLPPQSRDLVAIDPGYRKIAAICRPDVVCVGERVSALEINSDSPAMMSFADVVHNEQRSLFPLQDIAADCPPPPNRTTPLLRALLDCYREYGGKNTAPTIALVDWPGVNTLDEQRLTAELFTKLGCPAFTCGPADLRIEGGRLVANGRPIDIVQRRVLFKDFFSRRPELEVLLRAYQDGIVCMVNPLRSLLLGQKATLAWIRNQVTGDDRELVDRVLPETHLFRDDNRARIKKEREEWVLKPCVGHGGASVLIGSRTDDATWSDALDAANDGEWIIQRYMPPMYYRLPKFSGDAPIEMVPYFINWNPFIYGGTFAGAIGRSSSEPVVNIHQHGALLPVEVVE